MTKKRKQRISRGICFLLAFSMILGVGASVVSAAAISYEDSEGRRHTLEDFRDTKGHWAQPVLKKWAEYEIIVGDNGNFMPNKPITRADLAVVIDRLLGLREISYHYFQDLPKDAYYRDSMLKASAAGYIQGTSENTLNPRGYATREEVAVILTRIYKLDTVDIEGKMPKFRDSNEISSWAKTGVERMAKEGYMQGYEGKVRPKDRITRAEVITLLAGIADAYVPQRDVHGIGAEYRNDLSKNVVLSRNITMRDSNLSKDIVTTQSARTINLERVTVGRRILSLGASTINLSRVKVPSIELYDRGTINGMVEKETEVKLMTAKASGTRVDKIPKKVTLAPDTEIMIENTVYRNNTNKVKVLTYKNIVDQRADEDGNVTGGPSISRQSIKQDLSNKVVVEEVWLNEGLSDIIEIGLLEGDKGSRPTVTNNTGKYVRENKGEEKYHVSEPYSFTGGKVKEEKEYRLYAKDKNGLLGYSEVIRLGEYSFGTKFDVKAGEENYEVDITLEVAGKNMPVIRGVEVEYTDKRAASNRNSQSMRLENEESSKGWQTNTYKATVKLSDDDMTRDYGFKITYEDGNIQERYPAKRNFNPGNFERRYKLETGELQEKGREKVMIQENKISVENTEIKEYGVIYKIQKKGETIPTAVGQGTGWKSIKTGKEISAGNKDSYDIEIDMKKQGYDLYYAAYANVEGKKVYGELKKHHHNWAGEEGSAEIEGVEVHHLGTLAVIQIKLKGDKLIDADKKGVITNLRGSDGVLVQGVADKSLRDLNANIVQDLWGTKSITLVINERGLQGKGRATGELRLTGIDGKQTGKYSIALTPANEITYKAVKREGNKVSYKVATPGFASRVEIEKVISGTNHSASRVLEDGTILEVTKDSPGIESIMTVEIKFYVARSIGNIQTETVVTNITLP